MGFEINYYDWIFFQSQLLGVLHFVTSIHDQLAKGLGMIFSLNTAGEMVQSVLALLLIPAIIGVIVGIAHFFIGDVRFQLGSLPIVLFETISIFGIFFSPL